jgi:hypothetical protein
MERLAKFGFLCFLCICSVAQTESPQNSIRIEQQHTAWIADALRTIQTIKVGKTRADLSKLFTTEGGLSTTSQRTYVYRPCPYIKVDVKFDASVLGEELPTDRIIEVSRPYLAWSVQD